MLALIGALEKKIENLLLLPLLRSVMSSILDPEVFEGKQLLVIAILHTHH